MVLCFEPRSILHSARWSQDFPLHTYDRIACCSAHSLAAEKSVGGSHQQLVVLTLGMQDVAIALLHEITS